jgi:acyl-CoA reductase-like NAD-dependent aldehyde dehydrogenase
MAAFFRFAMTLDVPEDSFTDPMQRDVTIQRHPLGVVATIIPWNFPLLTIAFKVPLALLAGNTVIIKPAPTTGVEFGPVQNRAQFEKLKELLQDAQSKGGR